VYDPVFYRYLAVYSMGWYILNWTVSVMTVAATASTSFGLEPSAAMGWYILSWTVSAMMMTATAPTSFGLEPSAAMNWSA
jgi:hypothetical protein